MAGTLGTLNIIRGPAPPAPGAWQGSGRRRQRAVFKPVIQQDDENDAVSEASESSEGSLLDQAIAAQATPHRQTAPFKPPKPFELPRESIFGSFADSEDEFELALAQMQLPDPAAPPRAPIRPASFDDYSMRHAPFPPTTPFPPPIAPTTPFPQPNAPAPPGPSPADFAQTFSRAANGEARRRLLRDEISRWSAAAPRGHLFASHEACLVACVSEASGSPARLAFIDEVVASSLLSLLGTEEERGARIAARWLTVHPSGSALPEGLAAALTGKDASRASRALAHVRRIVGADGASALTIVPPLLTAVLSEACGASLSALALDLGPVLAQLLEQGGDHGVRPYDEVLAAAFGPPSDE